MSSNVKLVIFVPVTHADLIRKTLGDMGIGKKGDYDHCSFSIKGIGRFRSNENADPSVGEPGKYEEVDEEKIEFLVERSRVKEAIEKAKHVHPYEEPVFEVIALEELE